MREWKLAEARYAIVRERRYEVAVLPIGATEPHGLHLPYCTDDFEVESLADQACEKAHAMGARVILLPTIPYGVNTNQLALPLAMSVNPSTLNALITDLVRSLEHHGIPKMVILNGHGGNNFNNLLRELYGQTRVFLTWVDGWGIADSKTVFQNPGEHADEMETSWMLHLRPDLVDLQIAGDGSTRTPRIQAMKEGWAWFVRPWERVTQDSGYGDPRRATADKGARYLEMCSERLASFLKDLADAQIDPDFPY